MESPIGWFDFPVLALLLLVAGLDVAMRWLAFDKVDSVAIDIALFSCLYSLVLRQV